MNLNNQPTVDELARLFAVRKDTHDSHILWVSESGDVHIEGLEHHACEQAFESDRPQMRARLRTYRRGKGYVGRKAAADRDFMVKVFHTLQHECRPDMQTEGVRVIDRYC